LHWYLLIPKAGSVQLAL